MHIVKSIVALVVTLLLISSAVYYKYNEGHANGGAEGKDVTITIAYLPITHSIPLFEAKERLEKEGHVKVKLVKYGGWSELMDALNTGHVDGASVLIELAMKSKEQGIPLELVALGHRDGNVVITSNKINTPDDLKGKTFAIPSVQSSHNILLRQLLQKNNVDVSDVTIVEMAPAEMPAALQSGQIDGYCVAEPFGAKAVAAGIGKVFATSQDLWPDSICCGIVLNADAVKDKQDAVRTFEKVFRESGDSLTPEESARLAKKYLNQPEDISNISLQWISFKNPTVTEAAYQKLTDSVKAFGLSANPPTYQDFVKDQP